MSDAEYGRHGKNYSRKGRYHKKGLSQPAGKSKSQMAEKSQVVREKPAVKPATRIDHLIEFEREHEQAVSKFVIREKRQRQITDAVLLCMALSIGGMVVVVLLYGR
jgi:hypothetical protein